MSVLETPPGGAADHARGRGHLRELDCVTATTLIFSSDGHLLMGQEGSARRRAHPRAWHLPGGQVEEGELVRDAAVRTVGEQVGLRLVSEQLTEVPFVGEDEAVKTLDTGEVVWCRMKLDRFEARLPATSTRLDEQARPSGCMATLRWFTPHELAGVELTPGLREFLVRAKYIQARHTGPARS